MAVRKEPATRAPRLSLPTGCSYSGVIQPLASPAPALPPSATTFRGRKGKPAAGVWGRGRSMRVKVEIARKSLGMHKRPFLF